MPTLPHFRLAAVLTLLLTAGIRQGRCQYEHEIDSLQRLLTRPKEDTSRAGVLIRLAYYIGDYDVRKALQYEKEAYALSRKLGYASGLARSAYQLSQAYMSMGNYPLSDSFLTEAERYFVRVHDKFYMAAVENERGDWCFMQSNYWGAAEHYTNAAEAFDRNKDTISSLIAYQNLVAVLAEVEDFEKAVAIGKKILPVAQRRKDTLQIGYTLQGLATDLIDLKRMREAEACLPPLLAIAGRTPDNNLASDAYSTVATYYYYRKDYAAAIAYYKKALSKAETLQSQFQLANHHKSIASAYLGLNDLVNARKHLEKALDLAGKANNKKAQMNANLSYSEYFEKLHDYRKADQYLHRHLELKDSTSDARTRNYAQYLESRYETEKKEKEILRLQAVEAEKDFGIRRRNIYIGVAAGLVLTLIVISLLLRRNYRSRQRLSVQQARLREEKIANMERQQQVVSLQSMINGQETERTRIARDLHDGLGGLFSTVKMHFSALRHEVGGLQDNSLYKKTMDMVDSAGEELRKIAHNMMPEVLMKLGLVEALKDFCGHINAGRLLHVSLQTYGMEEPLGSSTEVMLYRIIQELVNNIIKHAAATEAIIQFNRQGNRLSITVEDNGRGFDLRQAEENRHMGMETVKDRVSYLNGHLSIESRKDVGTTVMIQLLLNEA
ncbi:MAG TPA: sensor histidine kinase [Puia sp.]|nr:sensor histidine kinase [Puia sp.]